MKRKLASLLHDTMLLTSVTAFAANGSDVGEGYCYGGCDGYAYNDGNYCEGGYCRRGNGR